MRRFSYTPGRRSFILLVFAALAVAAVFLIVMTITSSQGPPLLFAIAWVGIFAWNAYWSLWRSSYRMDVDGDRLLWKTPLRQGEVRVSDIQAIRPGLIGQVAVIEVRDHEDLTCLARRGIAEFTAALADGRPIEVSLTWLEKLNRLDFGRNAFERLD